MKAEEKIFLLSVENNYNSNLNCGYDDIIKSFCNLINFYISYSIENMNIKDKGIFFKGIMVVQNIFRIILLYTKNLELAVYNTQQSIYYYIEYISQITDKEDNIFFNLSIKDAVIYVYTRTIYEIKKNYVKKGTEVKKCTKLFNKLIICTNNYTNLMKGISESLFSMDPNEVLMLLNTLHPLFSKNKFNNDVNMFDNVEVKNYKEAVEFLNI
jgi:hypothetical protein